MKTLNSLQVGDCFRFVRGNWTSRIVGTVNNVTPDTIHYTMQGRQMISWRDASTAEESKTDYYLEVELV